MHKLYLPVLWGLFAWLAIVDPGVRSAQGQQISIRPVIQVRRIERESEVGKKLPSEKTQTTKTSDEGQNLFHAKTPLTTNA